MTDAKQPLLPQHVNRSSTHRLSTPRISFPSASPSALGPTDESYGEEDDGVAKPLNERRLDEGQEAGGPWTLSDQYHRNRKQGLPKLSRECLWSEIKCYGSYIIPTFLIFGVLAIGVSLLIYGWKRGWFRH